MTETTARSPNFELLAAKEVFVDANLRGPWVEVETLASLEVKMAVKSYVKPASGATEVVPGLLASGVAFAGLHDCTPVAFGRTVAFAGPRKGLNENLAEGMQRSRRFSTTSRTS